MPAAAGLVTGVGLVWTLLFVNVMTRCAIENLTPGSGCEVGDIGVYVAVAIGVLLLGAVGTVIAARRLRARDRAR